MPDGQTQPLEPSISLPRRLGGEPGKTILIVDDAQFLGMGLQRALRTAGFESLCVTSGARALAAITSRPISVVLTDLRMPEMSGEELLEWLNLSYPGLPCVVMTGYATRESITRLAHLPNVVGILVKPIEYNRLFATLDRALAQPQSTPETAGAVAPPQTLLVPAVNLLT